MNHALSWLPAYNSGSPNWPMADSNQFRKALDEIEELADAGYLPAQELAARMHLKGPADAGVSSKLSQKWLLRASKQGSKFAMGYLAHGYANGLYGFPKDRVESYKWAILSGDFRLIELDRISPNEKTEGERRAKEFVPKRES